MNDVTLRCIIALSERMVLYMPTGLQIHRQAVLIAYYLDQMKKKVNGNHEQTPAEITKVYDQPIQLTANILSELQIHTNSRIDVKNIQDIKKKYCIYQGYILSQLDKTVCDELCEDLKRLSE